MDFGGIISKSTMIDDSRHGSQLFVVLWLSQLSHIIFPDLLGKVMIVQVKLSTIKPYVKIEPAWPGVLLAMNLVRCLCVCQ